VPGSINYVPLPLTFQHRLVMWSAFFTANSYHAVLKDWSVCFNNFFFHRHDTYLPRKIVILGFKLSVQRLAVSKK
jgi:hypothetical protein